MCFNKDSEIFIIFKYTEIFGAVRLKLTPPSVSLSLSRVCVWEREKEKERERESVNSARLSRAVIVSLAFSACGETAAPLVSSRSDVIDFCSSSGGDTARQTVREPDRSDPFLRAERWIPQLGAREETQVRFCHLHNIHHRERERDARDLMSERIALIVSFILERACTEAVTYSDGIAVLCFSVIMFWNTMAFAWYFSVCEELPWYYQWYHGTVSENHCKSCWGHDCFALIVRRN